MRNRGILYHTDGLLLLIWFTLCIAGIFTIFSASSQGDWTTLTSLSSNHMRQLIFFGISIIAFLLILALDYEFISQLSPFFYILCLLLLLATLAIGAEINGSKSWIRIGSIQIQPAEFAKTGTALCLAYYLKYNDKAFQTVKRSIIPFLILGMPLALILLQGDLGSMLTFSFLFFVFYREGLTPTPIYIGFIAIALALLSIRFTPLYVGICLLLLFLSFLIYFQWIKKRKKSWVPLTILCIIALVYTFSVNYLFQTIPKQYQQDRVYIMLGMKHDPLGAEYNLMQSKMAISSGNIFGKGYMEGIQTHGGFIPEVHTDYIFSNLAEEWGFVGSLLLITLFTCLVFRLIFLAERQKTRFSRVFIYCAACFFMFHTFVNIAMVIGLFPTVGIPLPFFSKGGSSLLSFSLIIALVLRFDAEQVNLLGE